MRHWLKAKVLAQEEKKNPSAEDCICRRTLKTNSNVSSWMTLRTNCHVLRPLTLAHPVPHTLTLWPHAPIIPRP